MKFEKFEVQGPILITPEIFQDERGFVMESWHRERFARAGINADFVQENHSMSMRGVLRGLHYQISQPQGKLVRVISGAVFDVAVDIRCSSPTFGKWVSHILSAENRHMMWIPSGFAHGFYTLTEQAGFIYSITDYWAPEHERCIIWNDPDLAIKWPVADEPVLSEKDRRGVCFRDAECYV